MAGRDCCFHLVGRTDNTQVVKCLSSMQTAGHPNTTKAEANLSTEIMVVRVDTYAALRGICAGAIPFVQLPEHDLVERDDRIDTNVAGSHNLQWLEI